MDIKKFISNEKIDHDYNKIIQLEIEAIKHKTSGKKDTHKCLYMVSECNFLKPKLPISDMFKDPNIIEFIKMCRDDIILDNLSYSGPMIKRIMDPNPNFNKMVLPITNYYVVTLINTNSRPIDIIKEDIKKHIKMKNGYYIINTTESVFYLEKNPSPSLSASILSNKNILDRIALNGYELWVSGMFIFEMFKRVSCQDINITDPVFGYPEDILDIYDRTNIDIDTIKHLIDTVNIEDLQKIDSDKIESTFIVVDNHKYTVLEYTVYKMMEENIHPVISYQIKTMFLYLSKFQYFRPIIFVANMLGFNKIYPEMYETILKLKHKIVVDLSIDNKSLNSMNSMNSIYHIDMLILHHLIKTDDDDQFVDYIAGMGVVKKFKQESKTIEKIIDWMIKFKAIKIITALIDCDILSDHHRYKIIFLTQEFNLLGREFLRRYVLKREHIKISKTKESSDTLSHNSQSKTIDDKIDSGNYDKQLDDQLDDQKDIYYTISLQHQCIILNILQCIIEKSLTRSFFMVLKLCPYILESNCIKKTLSAHIKNNHGGNILHTINADSSVDILEIILKKNKILIDEKDDLGRTPLILFAELGLGKCIQKLIEYGADYDIVDDNSNTFIHKLCINGKLDIIQNVIRHVINIIDVKNDKMMTPALLATANKHEEIFYLLKGLNANLDEVDIYGNTVYHYICKSRICPGMIIINKQNKFGFTPNDYCKIDHKFYYFQK